MSSKRALEDQIAKLESENTKMDRKLFHYSLGESKKEQENAELKNFIDKLVEKILGGYKNTAEKVETMHEVYDFRIAFRNFKEFLDTGKDTIDATCLKDAFERATRVLVGGDGVANLCKKFKIQINDIESIIDQKHLEIKEYEKSVIDDKIENIYQKPHDSFDSIISNSNEVLKLLCLSSCTVAEIESIEFLRQTGMSTRNIVSSIIAERKYKA